MGRVIAATLDPAPKDFQPVWDHFESSCAYCGVLIERSSRKGHMDHAESKGGNHLGNFILACESCNGNEKREMHWRDFLAVKVPDELVRAERIARIEQWAELNPARPASSSPEVRAKEAELRAMVEDFGVKCAELREAVRSAQQ